MSRLGGLRPRLALLVTGLVAVSLAIAFAVVYQSTSSQLSDRTDRDLRAPATQTEPTRLAAAGIEADLLSREVSRDGHPVRLSAKEFELLVYLLRHPNQVLSREQLLSGVWGYDHEPGTNVVEVYVGYLRRKLALDGQPAPIDTVRSVGYRLTTR